jgi:hypothetical protein
MIKRIIITVLAMTGLFIMLINAHAQTGTLTTMVSINKVCEGTGIGFQSPSAPVGTSNENCHFECRHFEIREGRYVLIKVEQCNPKDYGMNPQDDFNM